MTLARIKKVFPTGLAFFALVFGSGNLVFPLLTGQKACGSYPFGMIGLMLTTVIISFISYIGVISSNGSVREYFKELPDFAYWFITLVIFFVIGPLYVIPRCALVAFGGAKELFPQLQIAYFSFGFLATAFVLAIKEEKVVGILEKFITPFKLGSILFIVLGALYMAPEGALPIITPYYAFIEGMKDGYQPMDMLGIIFFSSLFFTAIKQQLKAEKNNDPQEFYKRNFWVGVIGLLCIGAVYLLLVLLGAKYSLHTQNLPGEQIFPRITRIALGNTAAILIALSFFFSTLATALALLNAFATFLAVDILKKRIDRFTGLIIATIISYVMSLVGFEAIVHFAGTYILSWLYPCLIIFVIFKFIKLKVVR
ncbi:MAG: branched-chain amino acid transport system II carrier protein [Alphaproteobacteria bacterium]|nr:MAG: branched-chain amino acid transport system II carrier protein [Alphaproteobacteria bacterium]